MLKKLLLTIALIALAAWLYLSLREEPAIVLIADRDSLRDTRQGPVIGAADSADTWAWLGIPYAEPPVGELRWRAPRPPSPRKAPLEATSFQTICPQLWNRVAGIPGGEPGQVVGSEDCLYLNIWAPQKPTGPLPVMVWIHGGGNTVGTANTYPANRLAGGEALVVVTINYRLGMLGWLSHPALRTGDALDDSGNFGTLDIIAALQWVKDNIAAFGGDPDNVTIFGESAGGRNVYSMMASPLAAGLFHRGIVQSGSTRTAPRWRAENFTDEQPPGQALSSKEWIVSRLVTTGRAPTPQAGRDALEAMDTETLRRFLYGLTPAQMLSGLAGASGMYFSTQHFRDGVVLPQDSLYSVFSDPARYNAVPLMTGTNKDEMKLFLALDPRQVKRKLGFLPRLRNPAEFELLARYFSDNWRATAVDGPADIIAANAGAPVFAYRWDWDEGNSNWIVDYATLLGAAHGLEIGFIFDNYTQGIVVPGLYDEENIPGRDWLAQRMRSYWAQFAYSGAPGRGRDGELPQWRPWRSGQPALMVLDTQAGGGVRMSDKPLTVDMLKQRLATDPAITDTKMRCTLYAQLFLRANFGDDVWDEAEYRDLGCEGFDPWVLEARF